MYGDKLIQHSPMKAVAASIRGGLNPGQVGGILSRAGVGKAAMIVHVALNSLLRGNPVLHISLRDKQARVRSFYDEILSEVAYAADLQNTTNAQLGVERNRVIHSCVGCAFGPDDLEQLIQKMDEIMQFRPTTVVVHGLDSRGIDVSGWHAVAQARQIRVWLAVRTHRDGGPTPEDLAPSFDTAIALEPRGSDVALDVLRVGGQKPASHQALHLDPVSMLVRGEPVNDPMTAPPSPHPSTCSFYSTGARGAEVVFGEQAARWQIAETNFTFAGHEQTRTTGSTTLGDRELRAGAVSMVYVNHRLGRRWSKDALLSKVLQLLWHVVSHAQQVFVVGTIREDGTVVGGTGWSVELARKWHKPVWVFDQDKRSWFNWNGDAWVQGVPVIESPDFAGTGTRFLNDAGKAAIEDLFERSFGD